MKKSCDQLQGTLFYLDRTEYLLQWSVYRNMSKNTLRQKKVQWRREYGNSKYLLFIVTQLKCSNLIKVSLQLCLGTCFWKSARFTKWSPFLPACRSTLSSWNLLVSPQSFVWYIYNIYLKFLLFSIECFKEWNLNLQVDTFVWKLRQREKNWY